MHIGIECTTGLLKRSFRKLLAYAYYDKNDMHLRRSISEFVNKISQSQSVEDATFDSLERIANGQDEESLVRLLGEIRLLYFPKKLKNKEPLDKRYVTNAPREENEVARLLIRSYIPVELLIIDVAWILQHGYVLDMCLSENCKGNRLVLDETGKQPCSDDKILFRNYSHQYQSWWMKGIEKANDNLKLKKNVTIVNLDITDYYHTLDIDFEKVVNTIAGEQWHNDVRFAGTTKVVRRILNKYSEITHDSGIKIFSESQTKHPLPLSLMSSALMANWYLKPLDDKVRQNLKPFYYGRYVDDIMLVVETKSKDEEPLQRALEELSPLLTNNGEKLRIAIKENKIDSLEIQKDKVYVYSFSSSISQLGIEKYVSEQISRSSEFRYMTDEGAPSSLELENITLIGALDANYDEGKRFDILEESKYKLSVYLSKLASRLAKDPKDEKCKLEVRKIGLYFKGVLLIKHYLLWEKMLTLFVLIEQFSRLDKFAAAIEREIDNISFDCTAFLSARSHNGMMELKKSLRFHLEQSRIMALSLNSHGGNEDTLYSESLMVRMNFNSIPLQEFSKKFIEKGIKLSMRDIEPYPRINLLRYRWVPYYVKFADVVCACSLGRRFSGEIYSKAWKVYCQVNAFKDGPNYYKNFIQFSAKKGMPIAEFNTEKTFHEHSQSGISVSLIEMEMDKSPESMIRSFGTPNRIYDKKLRIALDKISENSNTDVFVMPECSLSVSELKDFCWYSARNRIAFICGLEYYICYKNAYNYILTCLPIRLHYRADSLPVLRRKCYYAPFEVKQLEKIGYRVPDNQEAQVLYHWGGHVFTSYCCFELCNPKHRSFFFNDVDAIYCSVYNQDTYYFNNIAESTARDMHCYFVLSNVSEYGDSRVSVPAKHDRMNLLKVKGGNTKENQVTILSCSLDYNKLRKFQRGEDKKSFKPIPPGFQKERVNRRVGNFLLKEKSVEQCDVLATILNQYNEQTMLRHD